MPCYSCVDKLAHKLIEHHNIDLLRAYELAEKGIERVEKNKEAIVPLVIDDPYDYTDSCNVSGTCTCKGATATCRNDTACINAGTCACACPDPPKANSHLESSTCAVTRTANCVCDTDARKCYPYVGEYCTCGCSGVCYYHCDDGYVWNPDTQQCELAPVVTEISVAGSVSGLGSLLRDKELTVVGSTVGAGALLSDRTFTILGSTTALGALLRDKNFAVQGLIDALGVATIQEIGPILKDVLGSTLAQGYVTVNKTIIIQGLIEALGTIIAGPHVAPTVPPPFPAGFVARRLLKNLLMTADGQVLLNLNMNKPIYMTLDGGFLLPLKQRKGEN